MRIESAAIALVIGFCLDLIVGDPRGYLNPARLIRWLTYKWERVIRRLLPRRRTAERIGGAILVLIVMLVVLVPVAGVLWLSYRIHYMLGIAVESVMCCLLIGTKTLKDRSMLVMDTLGDSDQRKGIKVASRFIGMDARMLSEEGILTSTVGKIAEYITDRVIAPMFYIAWGGVLLGYMYKAMNIMDQMVGFRNEKYRYFGTVAARLDDLLNYFPARISAVLMIISSWILQLDTASAIRIFRRDRYQHTSPNTAQTQSVMAGALQIELPGYIAHTEGPIPGPSIGDPTRQADENDIVHANKMLYATAILGIMLFGGIRILAAWLWYRNV